MNMMSSVFAVRNTDAFQASARRRERMPASHVRAATGASGGSATNAFGRRQGSSGSAQLNSDGAGTRDDMLKLP